MKKHLTILYGSDRKTNIVTNTVYVCSDYFDKITIINTAIPQFKSELESNLLSLNLGDKLHIEDIGYHIQETDAPRRVALQNMEVGDWLMWLDADERPTQHILNCLDELIEKFNESGINNCRFPVMDHLSDKNHQNGKLFLNRFQDKEYTYDEMQLKNPQTRKEWESVGAPFLMSRLYRKDAGVCVESNFGGHSWIHNKLRGNWEYCPHYINHYKSHQQSVLSCVLHTYFNMQANTSVLEHANELLKSEEFLKLREFQKRTGVILSDDLIRKLYIEKDECFKQELKLLLDTDIYKNSVIGPGDYKHYYKWAHDFDLSLDIPEETLICGRPCCKYKKIQL